MKAPVSRRRGKWPTLPTRTMDLLGVGEDGNLYVWSEAKQVQPLDRFALDAEGHIVSGHYVIERNGKAITAHIGNSATPGWVVVQYMCGGLAQAVTRPSKRAQVEALGWKLTAVPRRWEAGALWHNSQTGEKSRAHDDYKHPEAWTVTPPPSRNLPPRRFEGSSPNPAVRWAYDQAMAPELPVAVGGVLGLTALMASAARSGVVAEGGAEPASLLG